MCLTIELQVYLCLPMQFALFRLNACWSRRVFNFFLKLSRFGDSLMVLGSWFNIVGEEYLKDLVAKVLHLTWGLCNVIPLLFEYILSLLFFFVLMRSCKYFGAVPVMHLKVDVKFLYLILCSIGSQCNSFYAKDELEYLFLFKTSLEHMFWIAWYFPREDFGSPYRMAFA